MARVVVDYEVLVQATYEALLTPGDVAIDVGAHLGRHSIPMARRVHPGGTVFAFEPLAQCREDLVRRVSRDYSDLVSTLRVSPYALGDAEGPADFVVATDDLAYSGLRQRQYDRPTAVERIPVEVKRIDGLFIDLPSLRYMKIDAEGGEYHILRGGHACLEKFRPVVSFEFGANGLVEYGIGPRDMARLLGGHRYEVFDITGRHLHEAEFVESARAQRIWDYIAVPAETVGFFGETVLGPLERACSALRARASGDGVRRSRLTVPDGGRRLVLRPGQSAGVTATVVNTGSESWRTGPAGPRGPTRLGVLWFGVEGAGERLAEDRADLPREIAPGDEVTVKVPLRPIGYDGQPLAPGAYEVWIGLVEESVAWFYEDGDDVVVLPVLLEAS